MIEFDGVTKIYRTGAVELSALDGVSFAIDTGDLVAIMGPSGSGKSTMMNLMGCLDVPTDGGYRLDGIDTGSLSRNKLADIRNEKIGFVFQSFNLIPRISAVRNVELPLLYSGASGRRRRATDALRRVGLATHVRHMPSQMSGGQQQRVAIARAVVTEPRIILADEPTGNLDSANSAEIMRLLIELNNAGRTVVLITHDEEVANCAMRVITVRDGKIISDRAPKNRTSMSG
jgi:putative ABC transport system ATP-binding protein